MRVHAIITQTMWGIIIFSKTGIIIKTFMHKNYWDMTDQQLRELARKYNLREFMKETFVLTKDRKIETDFEIDRRDVINQFLQRDNRNLVFWSIIISVASLIISLTSLVL
jgi:hypothetical protein